MERPGAGREESEFCVNIVSFRHDSPLLMKILNLVLAAMFLVFAFLQLNDPDPVVWISIYGAMAIVCVLAAFGRRHIPSYIILAVIYIAYSTVDWQSIGRWFRSDDKAMLFDNVAKMQNLYIEESREYLGLMICIAVLILNGVVAIVQRRNHSA
jgi:hypothetical protein